MMGFGCNAAAIVSCRIIDSPRDRLVAILTNNFVPCNGRFPLLITLSSIFIAGNIVYGKSILVAAVILFLIVLSVFVTLAVSFLLSSTILKGESASFILELPSYRKPQFLKVISRSILDKILFVLGRAIVVSAPAGLVIWLLQNTTIGGYSIIHYLVIFLTPFANAIGLDAYILLAFILGLPANEIVLPLIIMFYTGNSSITDLNSIEAIRNLLLTHNWTYVTAICTMLFSLNHFPCGTTLLTIKKETGSWKWTFLAFLIPTVTGFLICFVVSQVCHLLGF